MKRIPLRALALAVAALALAAVSIVATASAKTQATTTITFWQTMNDEENETLKALDLEVRGSRTPPSRSTSRVSRSTSARTSSAPPPRRARRPTSCGRRSPTSPTGRRGASSPTSRVKVTAADKADFLPAAFAYYNYAGKIWGLPQAPDAPALLYNKRMVKAAGLNPNSRPATLAPLQGWCSKFGKGKGIFLRADSYWTQAWIWAYGGGLSTSQTKQILVAEQAVDRRA